MQPYFTIFSSYKYNDPELIKLFEAIDKMFAVIPGGFPEEKIPGLLYIWESQRRQQMRINCTFILDFVKKQFDEHCKTFDRSKRQIIITVKSKKLVRNHTSSTFKTNS